MTVRTIMNTIEGVMLARLIAKVDEIADGHLTIMKFTSNWRVAFWTPIDLLYVDHMPVGATFVEAAHAALAAPNADLPTRAEVDAAFKAKCAEIDVQIGWKR